MNVHVVMKGFVKIATDRVFYVDVTFVKSVLYIVVFAQGQYVIIMLMMKTRNIGGHLFTGKRNYTQVHVTSVKKNASEPCL